MVMPSFAIVSRQEIQWNSSESINVPSMSQSTARSTLICRPPSRSTPHKLGVRWPVCSLPRPPPRAPKFQADSCGHLHRSIYVALLLVAPHVQISVLAAVCQAVNQPAIAVEVEDDWLVNREQRIEVPVRQPMRMFRVRFQLEQIYYVDETDPKVGKLLAQENRCG